MNQDTQQAISRVEEFAKNWRWQRDKQDIAAVQDGHDTCVVLAIADLEVLIAQRKNANDIDPSLVDVNIEQIKAFAMLATRGEWHTKKHGVVIGGPVQHFTNGSGQQQILMALGCEWMEADEQYANANYVAAVYPDAMLALIARLEHAEARAKQIDEATQSTRFLHVKSSGLYDLLQTATLETDGVTQLAVYRSVDTGKVWVRPMSEFLERFVEVIAIETVTVQAAAPEHNDAAHDGAPRFFVYSSDGGYNEYKTDAERAEAHAADIAQYLDCGTDGWSEEVTTVVSGVVTHLTQKASGAVGNPGHGNTCECEPCAEYREAGGSDEYNEICDYEAVPIALAIGENVNV
jgi:hypothetical protein